MQTGGGARSVIIASCDQALRMRLRTSLSDMRWKVREAVGGADAMAQIEQQQPEALMLDNWLPDLEVGGFAKDLLDLYPGVDLLRIDGEPTPSPRSPRRNELLHALREAQDFASEPARAKDMRDSVSPPAPSRLVQALPGMVGETPIMLELARLIRLVAPTSATVLIEGETGTGKEIVARAVHSLSQRSTRPFVVLNCAAIPESLLEAELFGHTRGAFTGAVHSRTGRIEAAQNGTLFLDEIGEMPLPLQAKMLRFLESGELQRVGDNETMHADVRIVAATHQALEARATEGTFRLDLYHRLAVFPVDLPPLRDRLADVPMLAQFLLAQFLQTSPTMGSAKKRLSTGALERLLHHHWPGNVRELAHVLQRGSILSGDAAEIGVDEIRIRATPR